VKKEVIKLWKIAAPDGEARPEIGGLDKEEADFVSKYLALADELLNGNSSKLREAAKSKKAA
jgi:hypothetical protein